MPSALNGSVDRYKVKGYRQNIVHSLSQCARRRTLKSAHRKQAISTPHCGIAIALFPDEILIRCLCAILCTMFHRYGLYRDQFSCEFVGQINIHRYPCFSTLFLHWGSIRCHSQLLTLLHFGEAVNMLSKIIFLLCNGSVINVISTFGGRTRICSGIMLLRSANPARKTL